MSKHNASRQLDAVGQLFRLGVVNWQPAQAHSLACPARRSPRRHKQSYAKEAVEGRIKQNGSGSSTMNLAPQQAAHLCGMISERGGHSPPSPRRFTPLACRSSSIHRQGLRRARVRTAVSRPLLSSSTLHPGCGGPGGVKNAECEGLNSDFKASGGSPALLVARKPSLVPRARREVAHCERSP